MENNSKGMTWCVEMLVTVVANQFVRELWQCNYDAPKDVEDAIGLIRAMEVMGEIVKGSVSSVSS